MLSCGMGSEITTFCAVSGVSTKLEIFLHKSASRLGSLMSSWGAFNVQNNHRRAFLRKLNLSDLENTAPACRLGPRRLDFRILKTVHRRAFLIKIDPRNLDNTAQPYVSRLASRRLDLRTLTTLHRRAFLDLARYIYIYIHTFSGGCSYWPQGS
jgi:hypothetical protein